MLSCGEAKINKQKLKTNKKNPKDMNWVGTQWASFSNRKRTNANKLSSILLSF